MTKEVKKFEPTIAVLAFCWSSTSQLNHVLQSCGVYSPISISWEMNLITGGRNIYLDTEQKKLIMEMAEKKPAITFLWGSPGTGKTIIGVQAALMLVSHYKREGKKFRLFVCAHGFAVGLLEEMRNKYFATIAKEDNVKITDLGDLQETIGLEKTAPEMEIKDVNQLTEKIEECYHDSRNIIFIDEMRLKREWDDSRLGEKEEADYCGLKERSNLHLILATSPGADICTEQGRHFKVNPPIGLRTLTRQLLRPYRLCTENQRLVNFINHHKKYTCLSPENDERLDADLLPNGDIPTWFDGGDELEVLNHVKDMLEPGQSVTVIFALNSIENAAKFCREQEPPWKYTDDTEIFGCEDQVVVLHGLGAWSFDESWSRARNRIFIGPVTDEDSKDLFTDMMKHEDSNHKCSQWPDCPFIKQARLDVEFKPIIQKYPTH